MAINIVQDEAEAEKTLGWLKQEINDIWKKRGEIKPSFEIAKKPSILNFLKLLPKDNFRECGQPTCMVFASKVAERANEPENCPQLDI